MVEDVAALASLLLVLLRALSAVILKSCLLYVIHSERKCHVCLVTILRLFHKH